MPAVYQCERVTKDQARFLQEPNYAVVAAVRSDGSPHQTVTWVDWDGSDVLLNITETRGKRGYLEDDPRVSVLVVDRDDPYRWLSVSGTAELTTDGALEHIHKLSRKYRGREYDLPEGEQRVLVRVKPERVTAYGV